MMSPDGFLKTYPAKIRVPECNGKTRKIWGLLENFYITRTSEITTKNRGIRT